MENKDDMSDEEKRQDEETDEADAAKPDGPTAKLGAALEDFKEELQNRARPVVRAKKAAEQLCRQGTLDDIDRVQRYAGRLRDSNLEALDMEERRQKAVEALDKFIRTKKRKRRMHFMRQLHSVADDRDLDFQKLSESPLTMFISPLTVEADFEKGRVFLQYARITLAETDLDPEAVFEAHDQAVADLKTRTVDSEVFFDWLHDAYRLVVRNRDESDGERVDLVDLLAPLALMASSADQWRNPDLEGIPGYPPYMLSRQLAKLRGDGCLTRDGLRIDLGTATGGSTKNKEDVVFIPSGRDEGQYYLSIRFTSDD